MMFDSADRLPSSSKDESWSDPARSGSRAVARAVRVLLFSILK